MKKLPYLLPSLVVILFMQACTNSANKADSNTESATNNKDSLSIIKNGDAEFLKNAASSGMMEVELGKLAQTNASHKRVKNFGSMMVKDHSKANNELIALAQSKNIPLPESVNTSHQKHINLLKNRKGSAFDLTYINIMIRDHKGDVKKFKGAAKDAVDTDVKTFAVETLPVLQKHLDSAKAIHKVLKPALDNVIIP